MLSAVAALLLIVPSPARAGLFRRPPQAEAPRAARAAAATPSVAPSAMPSASAAPAALVSAVGVQEMPAAAAEPAAGEEQARGAGRLFDGGPAKLAALDELARPWSTAAQLERLSAEPSAHADRVRFSVIGDADPGEYWFLRLANRRGRGVFERFLSRAGGESEFIVQLGDLISRGTPRNFRRLFQRLAASSPSRPFLTVPGNHERSSPREKRPGNVDLYRRLFGPTDHFFDRAGVRFVFLDTSARRLTPAQLSWLDRTLDAGAEISRKIVFTHIAPDGLAPWSDFLGKKGVGSFGPGAAEFMAIAARRLVDRVYFGHVHGFDVIDRDGVRYVLTGGGGSPLFAINVRERFFHFLSVEAGKDGIREVVHRADGTAFSLVPPR
jgi:hypothetical protein